MKSNGLLELLQERTQRPLYPPAEIGVPGLMHFLYKVYHLSRDLFCLLLVLSLQGSSQREREGEPSQR